MNGAGWWVKPNAQAKFPNHYLIFDSEARRHVTRQGETQTFRCAVAVDHKRETNDDEWGPPRWAEFDSAAGLWDWVSRKAGGRGRTIVVAHNIGYDAQLTSVITLLPTLGWVMEPPSITPDRLVLRFKRGSARIVLIDSLQWLPKSLDAIGEAMGLRKHPLPGDGDPEAVWMDRCRRDVEILSQAWMRLMGWAQAADLGNWQATGAGMAMTVWRHKHLRHRVLIHHDDDARAAERDAMWCGRAEAWRHGVVPGGPFVEWDLRTCYGQIMADSPVPTIFRRHVDQPTLRALYLARRRSAVLARVTVTTETPCVPCRGPRGVLWPVGRFDTILWDVEQALVEEGGGTVEPHELWVYDRAPALESFARWALAIVRAGPGDVDPVVQIAVKHMTRALAGKFGGRYWEWVGIGDSPEPDGRLGRWCDPASPATNRYLSLNGQLFLNGPLHDSDQSCPQILSWIQAETRARLWRGMSLVGFDHLAYVDTDGMIVDRVGHRIMEEWASPLWREKGRWAELEILGPRRLITDGKLRASGIPKGAVPVGGDRWAGELWRSQVAAYEQRNDGTVAVRRRLWKLGTKDFRRVSGVDGSTAAFRMWEGPETLMQ